MGAALGGASTNDLMSLAEILDSNPQDVKPEQWIELFSGFKNNDCLINFVASNCSISDGPAMELNKSLNMNQSLKSLNLDGNMISPTTIGEMFEAINNGS